MNIDAVAKKVHLEVIVGNEEEVTKKFDKFKYGKLNAQILGIDTTSLFVNGVIHLTLTIAYTDGYN